jgi:hypothetical protein
MFLPGSMEWQAWHFLKTRRPAAASPPVGVALGVGFAGACAIVALGGGVVLAAAWS